MATHEQIQPAEQLGTMLQAADNYIEGLNIPPNSPILLVTDRLSESLSPDARWRRIMTTEVGLQLTWAGHRVETISFDNSDVADTMFQQTYETLKKLAQKNGQNSPVTIAYIGETWVNRRGFYDGIAQFCIDTKNQTRLAVSVGLNWDDIEVMSKIGEVELRSINGSIDDFLDIFTQKPRGIMDIETRLGDQVFTLNLKYDTSHAPFHADRGILDDNYPKPLQRGTGTIPNMVNLPGGEVFGTPYPFRETNGQFTAQRIVFTVENGFVTSAQVSDEARSHLEDPSNTEILTRLARGERIPLSELGIGMLTLAGIEAEGGSTLTREKRGPHIGFGNVPGESEEGAAIAQASGDFTHTDFVLDNPVIRIRKDEQDQEDQVIYDYSLF